MVLISPKYFPEFPPHIRLSQCYSLLGYFTSTDNCVDIVRVNRMSIFRMECVLKHTAPCYTYPSAVATPSLRGGCLS